MTDYVGAALPDLTALLLAVLGLAIVNRLAEARSITKRRTYWIILIAVGLTWFGGLIFKMVDVSESRAFRERRDDLARMLNQHVEAGYGLLQRIANDKDVSDVTRCRDPLVRERYELAHGEWRDSVSKLLHQELPGAEADRRFLNVRERHPPTTCGAIDWIYFRQFDLVTNLTSIRESLDHYCRSVGPKCRRDPSVSK